jgi:hypothetical protein
MSSTSITERQRALRKLMTTRRAWTPAATYFTSTAAVKFIKISSNDIVQVTGYGKQHVKPDGLPGSRALLADGTRRTELDVPFVAMVERFLLELKAGVLFFSVHFPDHAGWTTSFWPEDRLEWRSLIERDGIRGGIILMFENIKYNGIAMDLTGAEV